MAESSNKRLAGKVAIVTGSGRGIGRCEALLTAQQGAKVVVSDIGSDSEGGSTAANVADEIRAAGGEAVATTDSVVTMEGARRTVDTAVQSFGRLDILVNNAGLRGGNPIDKLTEEEWDRVVDSHLKSSFAMIKFAVPVFKGQGGGVIVNTGSEAGLGMIFNAAYSSAKEGIAGLTRTVAREQGRFGQHDPAAREREYRRGRMGEPGLPEMAADGKGAGAVLDGRSRSLGTQSHRTSRTGCGVGGLALHRRGRKHQRAILFRCRRGDRTLVRTGTHPQSRAARRLGSRLARFVRARGDDGRHHQPVSNRGSAQGRRVAGNASQRRGQARTDLYLGPGAYRTAARTRTP